MIAGIVEVSLLVMAALAGLCVMGATIHDMRRIAREARVRHANGHIQKRRQPHLTVILPAVENLDQLENFLAALRRNRYPRYDVVAVMSRRVPLRRRHEISMNNHLRIYTPRHIYGLSRRITNAYTRSARGELVMIADAARNIEPTLMRDIVGVVRDTSIDGVLLYGPQREALRFLEVFQAIVQLSAQLVAKSLAGIGLLRRRPAGAPAVYRASQLILALRTQRRLKMTCGRGLQESTEPGLPRLTGYATVALGCFALLVAYCSYLAATLQTTWPLIISWTISSLWLVATIWFDETGTKVQKTALSMSVPVGYFLVAAAYIPTVAGEVLRRRRAI